MPGFSGQRADMAGNRTLLGNKMDKFLRENEDWMVERFGAERVKKMWNGARAMTMLEGTGRPVLPEIGRAHV